MYCSKCNCPKDNNSDRHSCRVHTILDNKCIYCGINYKTKNCNHEWKYNYLYYFNKISIKITK